jgi:hypothetical protein
LGIFLIIIPFLLIGNYDNLDKDTSDDGNIISLQNKSSFDSLDILFIGNSYCYNAVNISYFDSLNIHAFNLGIATAGVQFYDLVLNDYYDNVTSSPKKVLLLVTPMTFSSKSDNFSIYPIHRYLENEKSNFDIAFNFNRTGELSAMFKKSFLKGMANIVSEREIYDVKNRLKYKGYRPNAVVVNENKISKSEHFYLPLQSDNFDKSRLQDLLKIANRISLKGAEVIFFELPTNLLNNYFSTKYLSDYEDGLTSLSQKFEFISIDSSLFSQNDYRNIDHMNSSGAHIATKEIIRLLYEEKTRKPSRFYKRL